MKIHPYILASWRSSFEMSIKCLFFSKQLYLVRHCSKADVLWRIYSVPEHHQSAQPPSCRRHCTEIIYDCHNFYYHTDWPCRLHISLNSSMGYMNMVSMASRLFGCWTDLYIFNTAKACTESHCWKVSIGRGVQKNFQSITSKNQEQKHPSRTRRKFIRLPWDL